MSEGAVAVGSYHPCPLCSPEKTFLHRLQGLGREKTYFFKFPGAVGNNPSIISCAVH